MTWVFDKEHFARLNLKINALNWILADGAPEARQPLNRPEAAGSAPARQAGRKYQLVASLS